MVGGFEYVHVFSLAYMHLGGWGADARSTFEPDLNLPQCVGGSAAVHVI